VVTSLLGARAASKASRPRLTFLRVCALALAFAVAAAGFSVAAAEARAADAVPAAKKKSCKKTHRLHKGKCVRKAKRCKKTHRLQKGKCVKRKAKSPTPAAPQGPDPLSDADGDGLPYQWETTANTTTPPAVTPRRCKVKQRLRKGKCVPKCKKGRTLKRGKCVKKKSSKRRRPKARSSIAPASVAPLGANPNHKDIFVQIAYASEALRQNVACSELDAIVAAFANAPVANPDGKPGIDLHIDAGLSCPSRSYELGGSAIFDAGACPGVSPTFQAVQLPESRVGTFHVAAFAPTCGGGGGEGGAASSPGTEMVVFTDGQSFAHVLMHELGHNLGLDHPFPGQPNRLSSMNTRLQVSDTGNGSSEVLDFQRFAIPALDENNLSEVAGISAPPAAHRFYIQHFCAADPGWRAAWPGDGSVDWNCNSPAILLPPDFAQTIDPEPQAVDVNGDGQLTAFPATGNEWLTLNYASGGQIGPG